MPRTKLLWIPAVSMLAFTLGCSVEMPVAQTPTTPAPAPTPPPNTTTIAPPDSSMATTPSSEGATVALPSADAGAAPMPMPGVSTPPMPVVEGMPVGEGTAATNPTVPDYSIPTIETPVGSPGIGAPAAEGVATPTVPDYSIPSSAAATPSAPGALPPPGMPEGMPNYGQPGVAAAPPEKPFEEMTLAERAESCFKKGEETEGFRWLYAHAIASEMDEAGATLEQLRWLPGPKRPSLATRFGVAVKFDSPVALLALATAMPAIGDPVPGLIRGKEGQPAPGAEAAGSARPKEIPKTAPATLRFFSGDLGVKFLEKFEASRSDREWGEVLAELNGVGSLVANAGNPYGGEGYAMPSPTPSSESGSNDGDRKKPSLNLSLEGGRQVSPGIVWLGFESSGAAAARKAASLGVDCVLLLDVKVLIGRNAPPRNKTRISATDVASSKIVYSSDLLDQFDLYELRETRPNAPDPVDKAIDGMFEKLAPLYAMQEMPEISAESALNRARQLIADPPVDPLPALAEMRYYLHKGLLDEAQYAIACKNLATQQNVGERLASQTAEDRIAAVEKLVEAMSDAEEEPSEGSGAKSKPDKDKPSAEAAAPGGGAGPSEAATPTEGPMPVVP